MQYFTALKIGEKRVKAAQELLTRYAGHAMPALALKDNKENKWEPVGEENLFALVKDSNGYLIAFCDKNCIAKSIAQWFTEETKNEIIAKIMTEQKMNEYFGNLSLPV
jgi:O-succinylbenzoate synthase